MVSLDRVDKVIRKLKGKTMGRNKLGDYMFKRGFLLEDVVYKSNVEDSFIFYRVHEGMYEYVTIDIHAISWNIIRITGSSVRRDING